MRRKVSTFVAFFLLACVANAAVAQDQIRQWTGVSLPTESHGFVRGKDLDYEALTPGQGIATTYVKENAYSVTVYVYKASLDPFPTSLDDPRMMRERQDAIDALLSRARATGPLSRQITSTLWQAPTSPASTPVFLDHFIVYPNRLATNDSLYIWLAKNHIWKVRVTRAMSYSGETHISFLKELVQLSVAE